MVVSLLLLALLSSVALTGSLQHSTLHISGHIARRMWFLPINGKHEAPWVVKSVVDGRLRLRGGGNEEQGKEDGIVNAAVEEAINTITRNLQEVTGKDELRRLLPLLSSNTPLPWMDSHVHTLCLFFPQHVLIPSAGSCRRGLSRSIGAQQPRESRTLATYYRCARWATTEIWNHQCTCCGILASVGPTLYRSGVH